MTRARTRLVALGAVALVLMVPAAELPTTSAWTDDAYLGAQASTAESFACQAAEVVVTTDQAAPAERVQVRGIAADCLGEDIVVELYDANLDDTGGTPEEVRYATGFEGGTQDGWTGRGGGTAVAPVEDEAHEGTWSLAVTGRSAAWHGAWADLSDAFVEGVEHEVSVWVRQDSVPDATMVLTVEQNPPVAGQQWVRLGQVDAPSGQWTLIEGTYTRPPGVTSTQPIVETESGQNPTMAYWIDSVRVTVPGSPPGVDEGLVLAPGVVDGSSVTLPTNRAFAPVPVMPVRVWIGGVEVPARWEYNPPEPVRGCTVVGTGTFEAVPGVPCTVTGLTLNGVDQSAPARVARYVVGLSAPGIATDGSQRILFTVDLSTPDNVAFPGDWDWATSDVADYNLIPLEGFRCDQLPTLRTFAYAWGAGSGTVYFEAREEGPGTGNVVCER